MTEPTVHNIPMRTALCDPQKIIVGERLRPLDPEWVAKLERTIAEIGLQTPITVTAELNTGQPHRLVVGAHRLQAVKNLGWPTIPVLLFEGDERAARMWEISENLDQYELTVLERDIQLAEWIRLAEERAAFSAQVDPKIAKDGSTRGRPESGINQAARELGIERKDAQRAAKVGSLSDEAKAAAVEHGLDNNRSALLEAAKAQTAEEQVEALKGRKERKRPLDRSTILSHPRRGGLISSRNCGRISPKMKNLQFLFGCMTEK